MKKYFEYTESRKKGICCMQQKEGRPTGLDASCVGSASGKHIIWKKKQKGMGK